jgi:hypothetical protein
VTKRRARKEWGELGEEMRALPNDKWRDYVYHLVTQSPVGRGSLTRACRAAGFGKKSSPTNLAKLAWRMAQDVRLIAAVAAESKKVLRIGHPEAVAATLALVRNPKHPMHFRAVDAILSRSDPIESHSRHNIEVLHRTIDPDREALEELRALRHLGTSREIDERCSEEVYSELLARTTATDGILFMSYTPLKGGGGLTHRFLNEYSADRSDTRIEADQARHISAERRATLEESYLPHEREARIHGIPQLGIARVFPFPIETLVGTFDPDNDIKSWARWIVGIDFGFGHPFAAALCAWVNDTDEFYVVDGFRMERSEAFYHVKRLAGLCRGMRIPIAWPHDGLQHEKGSGQQLAEVYKRLGAPMLSTHAENHGGGFHTEPAIEEVLMKSQRFTIASHLTDLTEEILNYHRDEDYKIVRQRDDLISAARYAFMMRRKGKTLPECEGYGKTPGVGDYQRMAARNHEPQVCDGVDFNVFNT